MSMILMIPITRNYVSHKLLVRRRSTGTGKRDPRNTLFFVDNDNKEKNIRFAFTKRSIFVPFAFDR